MIRRDLDDISEDDLNRLIRDGRKEDKRLEYKALLDLDGKQKQKHKHHLVQEVSGFANEDGGDLVVGVADNDDGEAEKLIGMDLDSIDETKQRWGSVLRDNIEPPIPPNLLDMEDVEFQDMNGDDRVGIVVRTEGSWRAPHRETLTHRFYGRSPSGKQELDMGEIRDQFLETERFTERIKGFRDDRIEVIKQNQGALPVVDEPLLVLHVIPSNAFTRGAVLDPKSADRKNDHHPRLLTNRRAVSLSRYNTDGYLIAHTLREEQKANKYVQTFRSGAIEAVTNHGPVDRSETEGKSSYISSEFVREILKERLPEYISYLHEQDARYPYSVFLTILSAEGYYVVSSQEQILFRTNEIINTPEARFPEVMVESPSTETEDVVSNLMDYLYQAAGHEGEPESQKE